MSAQLAGRLAGVRERVAQAARRAGRDPAEVAVVGIAKRKPAAAVVEAVGAGLEHVGESYVQEARDKIDAVRAALPAGREPRWHFVGRLQRNKARDAVRCFDVIESLDRAELGDALEARAAREERRLDVLLQVSLCGEPQKGGVPPEEIRALLAASRGWPHLRVTGLMTIPAEADPAAGPEANRPVFRRLHELRRELAAEAAGRDLRELSMGMSADFEVAIEEGATWVRVGTAIFGPRD